MDRIKDYQAFIAIVEKGGLTAAARQLRRSLQSVSRSLAALEREVGVELIRRTTRRSAPTDAGLAFHRRLSVALGEIEAAKLETSSRRAEAMGILRVAGSTAFAPLYVVSALRCRLRVPASRSSETRSIAEYSVHERRRKSLPSGRPERRAAARRGGRS
jgi:DNA-binding transcriptional LysR family regulator